MILLKKIYSWFKGRWIGESRIVQDSPAYKGSILHFMPPSLWDEEIFLYRLVKQTWTGNRWETVKEMEFSAFELKTIGLRNLLKKGGLYEPNQEVVKDGHYCF